jgi:peptidyl-prolyl cis-trans isomerase C
MTRFFKPANSPQFALWVLALGFSVLDLRPSLAKGEPPAPAPPLPAAGVLATFDTGTITRADYEQVLAQKVPSQLAEIARPGGREALLESLVRYDLLAQEAERRGYGRRPEVQVAVEQSASDEMLSALMRVAPEAVPPEAIAREYTERSREFNRPAMRRATQIKVATEPEAKALSVELRGSDRENFARAAREKNLDARTRNQGGELGYFDREGNTDSGRPTGVPVPFVEETFKLKRVGDLSRPIEYGGGWSVVMWTGEMKPLVKPRAEVEPKLRQKLSIELSKRAIEKFEDELLAKYAPEVHPELVDAITLPPAVPLDIPEGFAAAPPDPRAPPIQIAPDGI